MISEQLGGKFTTMEKACTWEGGEEGIGSQKIWEMKGKFEIIRFSSGNVRRQLIQSLVLRGEVCDEYVK